MRKFLEKCEKSVKKCRNDLTFYTRLIFTFVFRPLFWLFLSFFWKWFFGPKIPISFGCFRAVSGRAWDQPRHWSIWRHSTSWGLGAGKKKTFLFDVPFVVVYFLCWVFYSVVCKTLHWTHINHQERQLASVDPKLINELLNLWSRNNRCKRNKRKQPSTQTTASRECINTTKTTNCTLLCARATSRAKTSQCNTVMTW